MISSILRSKNSENKKIAEGQPLCGQPSLPIIIAPSTPKVGSSNAKTHKNPVHRVAVNRILELLGRFELPTSSLPMTRSTD